MKCIGRLVRLVVVGIALTSCGFIKLYGPCDAPKQFDQVAVVGEWEILYSNTPRHWVADPLEGSVVVSGTVPYLIGPGATPTPLDKCTLYSPSVIWERCPQLRGPKYVLEGTERLIFHDDGTYEHSFVSGDYSYVSRGNRWELITATPDSPKLKMEGMKFFAEGIAWAESQHQMVLEAQVVDLLRIQEANRNNNPQNQAVRGVTYPDSGYIYLYPRMCDGSSSLAQMVFGPQDPDNQVTRYPVFRRAKAGG